MPLFDVYTTKILLEAVSPTSRTKSKYSKGLGGGMGGGPQIKDTKVKPGSKASTILYGDKKMPSGTDVYTQAIWGNAPALLNTAFSALEGATGGLFGASGLQNLLSGGVKSTLINTLSGIGSKIPGIANMSGLALGGANFAAKQAIRKSLADIYLGSGPIDQGTEAVLKALNPTIDINSFKADKAGRLGKLGKAVAGKTTQLASMGIDPLDWATKAFGAQSALQGYASIPARTQGAGIGGMGYLQKGRSRGIY